MQVSTTNLSSFLPANAHRILTAGLLSLTLTVGASTVSAQAVEARVDLSGLLCIDTTGEPFSDEPFVIGTSNVIGSSFTGEVYQPARKKYYPSSWSSYYIWTYPTFGNIDGNEIVFSNNRPMWKGWIQDGQTVVIPMAFWEADSNYSAHDYLTDMAKEIIRNAPSWLFGGGISSQSIMKMVIFSAKFIFGAGADDPLGNLAVTLTNQRGVLYKEVIAGEYSHMGGATYYKYKTVPYWEVNKYKNLGYKVVMTIGFTTTMAKSLYYGETSKSGKTVRVILDGAGGEKYQASVQVRTGPFTSKKPNGTCRTWRVESTKKRAY